MRLGRFGFTLLAGFIVACMGGAQGTFADSTNAFSEAIDDLDRHFQPLKPTLVMEYEGVYAFLGVELKGLAALRIAATEGTWEAGDSAAPIPACKLDFLLTNPRKKACESADLKLNKRTLCVLTMPDLQLLRYVKINDEIIKPLFGKNRRLKYLQMYDFEGERVRYLHHDLESGQVVTNLPNLEVMAKQSFEIGEVLKNLHLAYLAEGSTNQPVVPMHFNVNGEVKAFGLHTRKASVHAPLLQRQVTVLRGDILSAGQKGGGDNCFSVSCLPFREVAAARGDPLLDVLAAQGQDWYMVPVSGRYELFLGGIICTLTGIHGEQNPPKTL